MNVTFVMETAASLERSKLCSSIGDGMTVEDEQKYYAMLYRITNRGEPIEWDFYETVHTPFSLS